MIKKLLFSNVKNEPLDHKVISHQWNNVLEVWNNSKDEQSNAIGIERFLKLLLILTQFLTPGLYVRAFFGSYGRLSKHLGVEFYVILKFIFAFILLNTQLFNNFVINGYHLLIFWIWWMIFETVAYTANLVFCNDVFEKPHSYKRNIILIFIDYIQINLDYSSIYLFYHVLKSTLHDKEFVIIKSLDAAYFSFVSSLTIGYGDITPANDFGKQLIIGHILIFLIFGVLFINFYTSRIETKSKSFN